MTGLQLRTTKNPNEDRSLWLSNIKTGLNKNNNNNNKNPLEDWCLPVASVTKISRDDCDTHRASGASPNGSAVSRSVSQSGWQDESPLFDCRLL